MYFAVGSKRPRSLADAANATGRVHAQAVSRGIYNTDSLAIGEGAGKGTSVKSLTKIAARTVRFTKVAWA